MFPTGHLAFLFSLMLVVISFASTSVLAWDKGHRRRLEENTVLGRKSEALRAIIPHVHRTYFVASA
jgi:hypothetical protein